MLEAILVSSLSQALYPIHQQILHTTFQTDPSSDQFSLATLLPPGPVTGILHLDYCNSVLTGLSSVGTSLQSSLYMKRQVWTLNACTKPPVASPLTQ